MVEQAPVGKTRRRRSRAEVEQLIAEFEASGLNRTEFCRSRQLSLSTFARYRKRLRQQSAPSASIGRWIAVELAGAGPGRGGGADSGLAIALSTGRRIEIGRGFDSQTLIDLLGVLERR
jgi:hypothetical protein